MLDFLIDNIYCIFVCCIALCMYLCNMKLMYSPCTCGAFGLYPWQSAVRPFDGVEFVIDDAIGVCGAFLLNVSKSLKCVVNGASRNGRWPIPNARNWWPPFGPVLKKKIHLFLFVWFDAGKHVFLTNFVYILWIETARVYFHGWLF